MEKERDATASTSGGQHSGPGQPPKAGSHTVGAWLTQSLAAIKRRGRSTDDSLLSHSRMPMTSLGNVDMDQQHQILANSLASQSMPPAARSEALPAQAGADSSAEHAQHAQQGQSPAAGQPAKRKPGRPRKAVPGEPAYHPNIPASSSGHTALTSSAPATTDAAVANTHHMPASSLSPGAQLSPRRGMRESESQAADPPAGALIPHDNQHRGLGKASVAIDLSKLLKSRNKRQVRDGKASSSGPGVGKSPPSAEADSPQGALLPGADPPVTSHRQATAEPAAASAEAAAPASGMGSAALLSTDEAPAAPAAQADESATTLSAAQSGKKRRRGWPPKQPVIEVNSTAEQPVPDQPPVVPADATNGTEAVAAASAADGRGQETIALPRSAQKSAAEASQLQGEGMPAGLEAPGDGMSEADGGQGGSGVNEARGSRAGSWGPELPLSILLEGPHAKKRGRPYKSAANAEKAAERAARRAAAEAAEKAAYEAAAEAAQVVISAPPVKKRRGRPPKDPARLAAALAAYHASTQARQASLEAEEAFLNSGGHLEAPHVAAQAVAEEMQPEAAQEQQPEVLTPPPPTVTPKPVKKKRGRPPKAVAQAVVDNLNSPTDSLPIAALASDYARKNDAAAAGADDEDHDQAILDAAAVLTSSLPYPQEIAIRQSPTGKQGRHTKGKRRSSNSSADAVRPVAPQARQNRRPHRRLQERQSRERQHEREEMQPVREEQRPVEGQQESGGEEPKERSRRRQLEVVSSRATAILESIGPDSQTPADADMPSLGPQQASGSLGSRGDPAPASDSEATAPPQSGYPANRQHKSRHSSNQPATAATASLEEGGAEQDQEPVFFIPPETQPEALSGSKHERTQAQTDASSAGARRTGTASSPRLHGSMTAAAAAASAAAEVTSAAHAGSEPLPDDHVARLDMVTAESVHDPPAECQDSLVGDQLDSEAADMERDLEQTQTLAAASHEVASREEEAAPRSQHVSTSNASLVAGGVTETVKRSARHAQDLLAKKGSSTSKPALTEALQTDASKGPKLAEVLKDPMQLEQQQPELGIAQPAQAQQAQHDAQQNAQPALQQPVLALLSSGLPPIVLGTFQGDMQRARIILEAAGFLVPFDISSSLLPPDLTSSSPLQHPAVPALPAGLWTAQPAAQQANSSSEGEEEGLLVQDPAASGAEQALTEGASLHGAPSRKHNRDQTVGQTRPLKSPLRTGPSRPVPRAANKHGLPSNQTSKAAAAAAELSRGEHASPSRPQDTSPPDRDGLSQEEWEQMGFHGKLQGTGQDSLDEGGDALDPAGDAPGSGMKRHRKPSARVLQAHDDVVGGQQLAFEGYSPEDRPGRGRGRLGKRGRGSVHHIGGDDVRDATLPVKRTRTSKPHPSVVTSSNMDHDQPHIPRRKRSKPTELIRPLELLAAANAAAAARLAAGGHESDNEDTYLPDNLSCLAAAAAAESESDAELAGSHEDRHQAETRGLQPEGPNGALPQQHIHASHTEVHGGQRGGEALVGRPVAKRFGSHAALFRGKVGYYAPRLCPKAPFHIQYEDGDSEDLNREQVEAILV